VVGRLQGRVQLADGGYHSALIITDFASRYLITGEARLSQ
jgi:hypothetical protein